MNFGDVYFKAKEDFIIKGNCSICKNSVLIIASNVEKSKHKTKEVLLCSKGLKFPACRILYGFKQK